MKELNSTSIFSIFGQECLPEVWKAAGGDNARGCCSCSCMRRRGKLPRLLIQRVTNLLRLGKQMPTLWDQFDKQVLPLHLREACINQRGSNDTGSLPKRVAASQHKHTFLASVQIYQHIDKWCLDRKFLHSSVFLSFLFFFSKNRFKSCGKNSCTLEFSVICLNFKLMIINNTDDWLGLYLLHLMEHMDGGKLLQAAPDDHQKLGRNEKKNLELGIFLLLKHTRQCLKQIFLYYIKHCTNSISSACQ